MCGLAGIVNLNGQPLDAAAHQRIGRMLGHIRHRGPDGEGLSDHGNCLLAHARLSIIDLLSGQQPMHLNTAGEGDGYATGNMGLHLVFNGEIYNHRDLRAKLQRRGHVFHSDHSDTEVLLLGYREWGADLPKHLHGMFAFALWDDARQELFLCRDRTGKKPLYFRREGDAVAFGSLVATLVLGGAGPADIDRAALLAFLRYGYPFEGSMIRGIEEVPAASWMRFGAGGRVEADRYWRPPPVSRTSTAMGAVDALREVVTEAVESRLQADVPLGCFLSGGIDSSVIAAIAQKRLAAEGQQLQTFNVAMPDATYDESSHAQAVAAHIGARHTVLNAAPGSVIEDLQRLMAVSGEPTADSSLLPTYLLCREARKHVKVALSGDGGDELFGGYDRYRALRLLSRYRLALAAVPLRLLRGTHPKSHAVRLRRLVEAARAGGDAAAQYHRMVHLFTEDQIRDLQIEGVAPSATPPAVPDWPADVERLAEGAPGGDVVTTAMRWDLTHYLPFELLRKIDRASMAVALEARCPLLDTQVCDLAGHLPARVLMPGGRPKGLLRALASELLPMVIVNRPKRGFAVPIGGWLRTSLKEVLADHLFGPELRDLGVPAPLLRSLFNEHVEGAADHTHRLFALLQLALWLRWLKCPAPPAAA